MAVAVLGIRHHSPACARLVRWTIERARPQLVLLEGPSDLNGRVSELRLSHELPIALFTYRSDGQQTHSCWTPFCEHSPEWVALDAASRTGAEVRFIDLPGWHPAFWGVSNRYADRYDRTQIIAARLCSRFCVSDMDALWEHLFEQPLAEEELDARLRAYFAELRGEETADERDTIREAYMAACLAAARSESDRVLAVCGGWHAPALERTLAADQRETGEWPETPAPPPGSRVGSYLVPYSFHRLDSFTGYESGMPSPAFQDLSFREGTERAAERLLIDVVHRLRRKHQPVSTADLVSIRAMAEGLRRLRGHAEVSRIDLLDSLAAGLVKEALDVPAPWTYRGPIRPRTDPLLVEVVAAFSGDRVGRLAEDTPRPPLLADVRSQLELHGLVPGAARPTIQIDLTAAVDLARSRVLHRLRVLDIPGFTRANGPRWATDGTLTETWRIEQRLDTEGALIEAALYGPTLEGASAGRLEALLAAAGGRLAALASLLGEAAFIGIDALAARVLAEVSRAIGAEPSLADLGAALASLLGLWRHDVLLGAARSPAVGGVIEAAFERGLWLVEGVQGGPPGADMAQIGAVLALRDVLRHGKAELLIDRVRAHAVMDRRKEDAGAPPALRGAALGFLWSTGFFADVESGADAGTLAVRRAARPETLGDFLAGLFALAREETLRIAGLVETVDEATSDMSDEDFLVALPALRLAFSFFPPAEKEQIARLILAAHGGDPAGSRHLLRLTADPQLIARARALEAHVTRLAVRHGLQEADER